MRQVDSPFTADGHTIEPGTTLNRHGHMPPAALANPSVSSPGGDPDRWYAMEVKGTYLDGEWVAEQVEKKRSVIPADSDQIDTNARYAAILDRKTGLLIYLTEEKWETNIENGVVHPTDAR